METQKIVNLLNGSNNEYAKNKFFSHLSPIRFLTKSIESSLCDYSDIYIYIYIY